MPDPAQAASASVPAEPGSIATDPAQPVVVESAAEPLLIVRAPAEPVAAAARWRRGLWTLLALASVGVAAWLGFVTSVRQGTEAVRAEANHQLDLFASVVQGLVRRLEDVPATVQLHPDVLAVLRQPTDAQRVREANIYLRRLNAHMGSLSIYVLNQRGVVLAGSDGLALGEDLSFRPYFLDALAGRVGRHFAIGTRDGVPGYFVSHPIYDGAQVLGVAVVKIDLEPINQAWPLLGAPALLADSNQVVVLSSEPAWRYTALAELSVEHRVDAQLSRLYGDQRLGRLPLQVDLRIDEDTQVVEGLLPEGLRSTGPRNRPAGSRGMLVLGRTLDGMDWRLLVFTDLQVVRQQAVLMSLLAGISAGSLLLVAVLITQRRRITRQKLMAHRELEEKVALRTQALSSINARLRKEVAERERAEQTLRQAQNERVHAGKMAVLGQLATGITHELTQPLGAIRTLSANAVEFMRRGQSEVVTQNLDIMARLADQMGAIIQPLKGFARKSEPRPAATPVGPALQQALFLYDQRLRREQVQLVQELPDPTLAAWCDPNRLQQVLVNLIGNALDAMQGSDQACDTPRRLRLAARREAGGVCLDVHDSGPGLDEAVRARLFEPFFSTKDAGAGLGLGLAISRDIAREAGGELVADNHPVGGAVFSLRLPLPPTESP